MVLVIRACSFLGYELAKTDINFRAITKFFTSKDTNSVQ